MNNNLLTMTVEDAEKYIYQTFASLNYTVSAEILNFLIPDNTITPEEVEEMYVMASTQVECGSFAGRLLSVAYSHICGSNDKFTEYFMSSDYDSSRVFGDVISEMRELKHKEIHYTKECEKCGKGFNTPGEICIDCALGSCDDDEDIEINPLFLD